MSVKRLKTSKRSPGTTAMMRYMQCSRSVQWIPTKPLRSYCFKIDIQRAGVIVGSGMGGLQIFSESVQNLIERGRRKISPFFNPYSTTNMGSALLGIDLGVMGPNYSISTACATSNYCFHAAANHIRRDEADLMVVGGTEAPMK
ncbi:hypothetical protein NE237_006319 [Protea cynaroides]|uniref:beta-ketoacyl-[acyl-carrier-protein] synthase I n=1 Tax=Protea cynaroides TaxID=273540 RepID=A0A9Q0KMD5_9MAGN|nr:hypothetical protein NE237_006319 [Protea cynaroides]